MDNGIKESESESQNDRITSIITLLESMYPDAACGLKHSDPLQLLVSTQLSAQCTDKRVNEISAQLYEKYRNADDFAKADINELEDMIKSAGLYHNKAKNIKKACRMIIDRFNGKIPADMDELLKLPGVGRKTANLVLGEAFGIPGIVVDTHVLRLSNRLGIAHGTNPEKVEMQLKKVVSSKDWTKLGHLLISHGRAVCTAKNPKCKDCRLDSLCSHFSTCKSV